MSQKYRNTRRRKMQTALKAHLQKMSKEELIDLLLRLSDWSEEVCEELVADFGLQADAGSAKELAAWAKDAIHSGTRPGSDFGGDYDQVQRNLQQLLDAGHPQLVLHDDLVACLKLVFTALPALPPVEQKRWVWDLERRDTCDLSLDPAAAFWRQPFSQEAWSQFADDLRAELKASAKTKGRASSTSHFHQRTERKLQEVMSRTKPGGECS